MPMLAAIAPAALVLASLLPAAVAFGPPPPGPAPPPRAACKRGLLGGCWFRRYNSNEKGRCGEVDAAPRMPGDIWGDTTAVQK